MGFDRYVGSDAAQLVYILITFYLSDRTSIAITLPAYGTQSHLAISLLLNMIIGRDIRRGFPPLCTYTRTAL